MATAPVFNDANKKKAEELAKAIREYSFGKYASKYQPTIEALAKSLVDGTFFNENTDKRAIQYRNDYTRMGRQAMEDTIGKVAARTGGLASSYATAAAEQAYGNYMQELAGRILDLRNQAEKSTRDNIAMYQGLDNTAYGRWYDEGNRNYGILKDSANNYNNLTNTDLGLYNAALSQYQADRNYELEKEKLAAQQAAAEAARSYSVRSSSGGGGGGSYSSSDSGVSAVDVAKGVASTALNAFKDAFTNNIVGSNSHSYTSNSRGADLNQGVSYSLNGLGGVAKPGIDYSKDPRFH